MNPRWSQRYLFMYMYSNILWEMSYLKNTFAPALNAATSKYDAKKAFTRHLLSMRVELVSFEP